MDLKEAYEVIKKEWHAAERKVKKLEKELEKFRKEGASDSRVQKLLSQIQGLNKKISQYKSLADRYQELYEKERAKVKELENDKYSLELENLHLKDKLELLEEGSSEKITASKEAEAQIAALKDEVARLTARLNNNGTNTGTPTSRTAIDQKKVIPNSREKSDLSKGGQPGHEKYEMAQFSEEEITDTIPHELSECPNCGGHNLEEIEVSVKDEFDYEVKVIKHRHNFVIYKCLDCGATVRAPLGSLKAANQYGKVIQAMALSLMDLGFVSINRTKKILTGFSPEPLTLSEGYLAKLQKRYSKKLHAFVTDLKNLIIGLPLIYWDDTVVFVNTARACMRFYGNERIALYTAHMHKDLDGILEDNILPVLSSGTKVMHDHNTINYHEGFVFRNVECNQHLERDLQKLFDSSSHSWVKVLKELIQSMMHDRKHLIAEGATTFSKEAVEAFLMKVDSLLDSGYKEYIADLGHYYESDENALLNRIKEYKSNYFDWVKDFSIPTTNNLSERSLRFVKTKDKVSGQFQSIEYASYFADIRTYLETCARNGVNEFTALLILTSGEPYTVEELLGGA